MKKDELKQVLAQLVGIEESSISEDTQLSDIGFDSIQFITFIVAIEEKYDIEVLDSDLLYENFTTLDMMYTTLSKYFEDEKPIYKCIITDCDGVLWKGIAGESGVDEAHYDVASIKFCNLLHDLRMRGVMIAACSKNEETNILMMLDSDDTVLSSDDLVLIETGVMNKAESAAAIIDELGIYQDSVVFVDDGDYELGLVSTVLPDLKTVKANDGFIEEITALFDNLPNESDIDRTAQCKEQKEREKVHVHTNSAAEYNITLETVVICRKAEKSDIPRMAELSQRANRFNINGKRYTEDELSTMLHDDKYGLYILKASDKYGDMGLVAMSVVNGCDIESFMLSCRVFGRDFEVMLLNEMKRDVNAPLRGRHIQTGKNDYCKDFFIANGVIS